MEKITGRREGAGGGGGGGRGDGSLNMKRNLLRTDRVDGGFLRNDSRAIAADGSFNDSELRIGDAKETPGPATVWTDEKHHFYLRSLEASFVQQLHQSITICGCLQRPDSSLRSKGCSSSQQLGSQSYWDEHLLESISYSRFAQGSSRDTKPVASNDLHTGRVKDVKRTRNALSVSSASTQCLKESECCLSCQDSVQSVLEFSDQNFINSEVEENTNCASTLKGSKTNAKNRQY